jgi:8-oxo-dGTP pyrophosphatase MutT (NUDIX family)
MKSDAPRLPLTHGEAAGARTPTVVRAAVRVAIISIETDLTRFLLVHHPKKGWEFPGGAVAPGEDARDTALRELREEAGLVLDSTSPMQFAGTIPVTGVLGGHWIDIVFYTLLASSDRFVQCEEHEFRTDWLAAEAVDNLHTKAIGVLLSKTLPSV